MEEPCAMVRMHGSVRGASNRPYSIFASAPHAAARHHEATQLMKMIDKI